MHHGSAQPGLKMKSSLGREQVKGSCLRAVAFITSLRTRRKRLPISTRLMQVGGEGADEGRVATITVEGDIARLGGIDHQRSAIWLHPAEAAGYGVRCGSCGSCWRGKDCCGRRPG